MTNADYDREWADLVDEVENGLIQNPLGVPMAPNQPVTLLVTVAREVVKEAEDAAEAEHKAEHTAQEWHSYLSPRIKRLAAVLKQFEDIP